MRGDTGTGLLTLGDEIEWDSRIDIDPALNGLICIASLHVVYRLNYCVRLSLFAEFFYDAFALAAEVGGIIFGFTLCLVFILIGLIRNVAVMQRDRLGLLTAPATSGVMVCSPWPGTWICRVFSMVRYWN